MAYNILNKNSMDANTYIADTAEDMFDICIKTDLPIGTKCICLNLSNDDEVLRGLYLWSPNAYLRDYILDVGPQIEVLSKDQKIASLKDFKAIDILTEKYQQNLQELVVIIPGQWQLIEPLGGPNIGQEAELRRQDKVVIGGFGNTSAHPFFSPEYPPIMPLAGGLISGDSSEALSSSQKMIDQINAQTPFGMIIRIPGYTPPLNPGHVS